MSVQRSPSARSGSAPSRSILLDALTRWGPDGLVLWTIAISAVIRLHLAVSLGYGIGEGYYLASARHLALSYFDQPPLSLWVAWLAIQAAGVGNTLATRLPFLFMFVVTTWLMYRLGAKLFGAWAGAWAAVLLNLSLVFTTSIASWVQPDGPLFLFLLAATIPVADLCFGKPTRPLRLWMLAGLFFGLAFLAKYHAVLTLCGLLVFVLTTPSCRQWVVGRGPLVAGVVSAAVALPVIVWNWQHDWISFAFQGGRLGGEGLHFDWLARSIGGQAVLVGLLIWPALIAVMFKGFRAGPRDAKAWFLCCLAIVPIVLFTLAALWAPLGYHFHWQAPGYLFLFPLLGKSVAERLEAGDVLTRRWLGISAVLLVAVVVAIAAQARTGWMRALMPASVRAEPYDKTNPTRELLRWSGLREALVKEGLIPKDRLFAVSTSWTWVGKVDTEIGDDVPVVVLSPDPRNIAFGWNDRDFIGWDALIVTASSDATDAVGAYGPYFRAMDQPRRVDVRLGGEVALSLNVTLAHGYDGRYPLPFAHGR